MIPTELTLVVTALTDLMISKVGSSDPRRFTIVNSVTKITQQLIRSLSLRVADFGDPERLPSKSAFWKGFSKSGTSLVVVPDGLTRESQDVVDAMTRVIVSTLESERDTRFAEAERLSETALNFLESIAPPKPKHGKRRRVDEDQVGCENPEAAYIRQGIAELVADQVGEDEEEPVMMGAMVQLEGPKDVNELRREILDAEGTNSQIAAEAAHAYVARNEAEELTHLFSVQKHGGPSLTAAATTRIAELEARLVFRTKRMTNDVVSTNVSRGHLAHRAGTRHHDPQGDEGHTGRAEGTRKPPQESLGETVGVFAVGDA